MPSSIYVNGQRVYVPGLYGKINASALAATGLTVGGIAVVGSFPTLEHAVPKVFQTARQVASWDGNDKVMARIAQMAFQPSSDDRAPGGANPLILVNAQENTQASRTLYDATGLEALVIKSKYWGVKGNHVNVLSDTNTLDATLQDFIVKLDGETETFSALGSGSMISAGYQSPVGDTALLTDMKLQVSPRTTFAKSGTLAAGAATIDMSKVLPLKTGTITATTSVDATQPIEVTLKGYDAYGKYQQETLQSVAVATPKSSAKKWSSVSSADVATADNASTATITLSGSSAQALRMVWEKTIAYVGATTSFLPVSPWSPSDNMKLNSGHITIALTVAASVGKTISFVFTGRDHTNAMMTETVDFANADGTTPKSTTTKWSSLTSVTYTGDSTANTSITISGESFYIDFTATKTLKQVADEINVVSALGYFATVDNAKSGTVLARECDEVALGTTCFTSSGASVRADLWAIIDLLSGSDFITVSRATNAGAQPAPYGGGVFLLGGTETVATTDMYSDAFDSLLPRTDVQKVVAFGDDSFDASETLTLAMNTKMVAFIRSAAIFGHECAGYIAWPYQSNKTITDIKAFIKQVNSRSVSVGAQKLVSNDPDGTTQTLESKYRALQMAAMKVAVGLCEPVTEKRPTVSDVISVWTPFLDDNEVIPAGIQALTYEEGWKELRGITSYLTDDNPVLSESSSVESCDTSIRMLRADLKSLVGQKNTITATKLAELVTTSLKKQVKAGVIKDWRNVSVDDEGDVYNIVYECAPVEPFNFANVELRAIRF